MLEKLKIVHVGCGGMSPAWLAAAKENRRVEIVGLVDLAEDLAAARREEFAFAKARVGRDLDAMLAATKPDIVFDCTVPKAHVEVTLTALRHSCHVLGEKPMAENSRDARRMTLAAQRAGKLYAVMQNRRYTDEIRAFRKLLTTGPLGQLTTLHSDFFVGPHFGGFRDAMRHVLLLDMTIHHFDMARFLSGADPIAVWCHEWNPAGSWYAHGASAVATFEMTNGLVYTYRGSWCAEGVPTSWEAEWRALCEHGSAMWDGGKNIRAQAVKKRDGFTSKFRDVPAPILASGKPNGHPALILDFIECVRKGRTPQTNCADNIKSFAMVMAAIKSAESGKRVPINP